MTTMQRWEVTAAAMPVVLVTAWEALYDRVKLDALAKADASVAIQQAALTNLDATWHLQAAIVAQAQAIIAAADAEIVRTRDDQVRFSRLLKDSAVSVQESQKTDADYKEAMAVGEKSRAGLTAAAAAVRGDRHVRH
jgi:membrane fusion protein (multidrug efflux system)